MSEASSYLVEFNKEPYSNDKKCRRLFPK